MKALFGRRMWLRWIHLVLGGALLMPFWFVGTVVVSAALGGEGLFSSLGQQLGAYALALPLAAVTALFPLTRPLSVAAVRALCGVPDASLADGPARSRAAKGRTAAWFTLHLGLGALLSALTLALVPMGAVLLLRPVFSGLRDSSVGMGEIFDGWPGAVAPVVGIAVLAALVLCATGTGTLLARCAPPLLGPTPADRLAAAEERAAELAVRNRLARELHDSVGHALSAVTLQASAARRVLDSDPEFAREALLAIEDTTRRTVGELDAVLGLLRAGDDEDPASAGAATAPAPTLAADLDGLLARTRAAGLPIDAALDADPAALPDLVSREAYRIVQEGLSNALRHAESSPVTLRIARHHEELEIVMENPVPPGPGASPPSGALSGAPSGALPGAASRRPGGGRGLYGIAERAKLLGGTSRAGLADGRWTLSVRLPVSGAPTLSRGASEAGGAR
ncbi:sensor histidine kinase [Streptomyces apocyni]|uniref:sensor histidine kinase n=1 Tax=Streptomyces apocyni TaxID=2654677 RepID=UPI0012E9B2B6|nr:histidine kinase [Streptomyces apocyni]